MMRAGIPMREVDRTELGMYLRVLSHTSRHARREQDDGARRASDGKVRPVIELRRGYIDDIFG